VGWLTDLTLPFEVPFVEIVLDGKVIAEGKANLFRQDLLDAGVGVGHHGFEIVLPESLFDGQERQVSARSKRYAQFLQGSPRSVNTRLVSASDALNVSDLVALEKRLGQLEAAVQEQNGLLQVIYDVLASGGLPGRKAIDRGAFFEGCKTAKRDRGDVLVFSIIDWNFRIQRPQHLSARLAALGYRVMYVSVQIAQHQRRWDSRFEVRSSPAPGVFDIQLRIPGEQPSVYTGFSNSSQLKDVVLALDELVRTLDVRRPQAIIQFPSWYPVAQSLPGAVLVYDCLDLMEGFSNVSPQVSDLEKQLVRKSDVVITTSAYLQEKVEQTRFATTIRNGCEFEYFSERPSSLALERDRPVVGYFGAIAEWFDVDLVTKVAKRHPEWDFVLIGSTVGCELGDLPSLANVSLLGEKPYKELTQYLYGFNVCIIPFKTVELIKATNPVKLYEYMASGKPVVCTDLSEARLAPPHLLHIAATVDEFDAALEESIRDKSHVLVNERRAWAARNSWDARAAQYDDVLRNSAPRVSVVVLTYNGLAFTRACLDSVDQFSNYSNLEVICVDNSSTDGTREFLEAWSKDHPQHRVILNDDNLGFAAGNNVGIEAATGEIIILLNNDTYVTDGWVQDLIRPLVQDKTVGLAGPVTNMIGGVQKISIHYSDMTEMAERARAFTMFRKHSIYETDAVAFFCVAFRRDLVEQIGVLDPIFGVGFFEDDDYCQRAKEAGFKIVCADGVFVHHHLSASFNELEHGAKGKLFKKNREIYESRWGKWEPHQYREEPGFGE